MQVDPTELELGEGQMLLLADDQPLLRETTRMLLESLGYQVMEAETGLAAVELFEVEKDRIDLALLDIGMPGLDGVEVARRIRAQRPSIPIVFITGFDHGLLTDHGIPGPEPEVLEKPFDLAVLARTLARGLRD